MNVWMQNLDYIYFLYGLAFFFLVLVCLAHRNRAPQGFSCCWLGVFAGVHGVNEWLDMAALAVVPSVSFNGLRLFVLSASFLALFEFGRRHARLRRSVKLGLWSYVPFLLLFAAGVWRHGILDSGFLWARLCFGLPGGLLAAWALWDMAARAADRARRAWLLAAGSMLAYVLLAGLVVSPHELLPAFWPDHDRWFRWLGVPVPVFRMIAAGLIAGGVWWAYELNWEEKVGRYMAALNMASGRWTAAVLIVILLLGGLATHGLGARRSDRIHRDMLRVIKAFSEAVNVERLRTMGSQDEARLREQLQGMAAAHPLYDRLYIAVPVEEQWRITVESNALDERATREEEATIPFAAAVEQAGPMIVHRPDVHVIDVLVPLHDSEHARPLAVFGAEVDQADWYRQIAQARMLSISATMFVSLLTLGMYVVIRQNEEQHWAALLRLALEGGDLAIWDWDVPSGRIIFDEGYGRLLGYDHAEISPHIDGWKALLHPDDRGRVGSILDKHLRGDSDRYEAEYRIRHKDGRWISFVDRGRVIERTRGGKPLRCTGTFVDVTSQRMAAARERESETTYRNLINSVSEAVYVQDAEGRFLDVNAAAERMYGYDRNVLIGKTPEFLAAAGKNNLVELAQRVKAAMSGAPQFFEFWGRRCDGTIFPKDVSLTPATYCGQPAVIAVARETSERKRQEQIREVIYRLRELADRASSLASFCEEMQPLINELIPARNLMLAVRNDATGWIDFPYVKDEKDPAPPSRPPAKGLTDYLLETGRSLRWSAPGTRDAVRLAGYAPLGAMAHEWIGIPLKREGKPFGALLVQDYSKTVNYDDTDLQFMEQVAEKVAAIAVQFSAAHALRESEEMYRKLFTSMTSSFALHELVYDAEGRPCDNCFIEVNPVFEQQTGLSAAQVLGRPMREVFPNVPPEWIKTVLHVALTGEAIWREFEFSPLNKIFEVVAYSPKQGQCASIFTDVTDRKRMEEERLNMERQLQHAQKLESLGIMAGGIAHDFNNLLMVILGNLDLSCKDAPVATPVRLGIEEAMQAAKRAAELTRQMLAYSGKGVFTVCDLNVNEALETNAQMLKAAVPKNVTFQLQLKDELPPIRADVGQIQQVIMNLITNAAEAIGEQPGVVTLATGVRSCKASYLARSYLEEKPVPGEFVWVEVTDSGCGMDPDVLRRLFDPFFSTKFTGRGLGLSAVLGIVRGHEGAILIDTKPGQGSTFRVLFPLAEFPMPPGGKAPAVTESLQPLGVPSHEERIVLVVEDEPAVRKLCENAIQRCGFNVLTANDGRDALPLFLRHQEQIAGVLLDLTMPGMDGATTIRELRRIDPNVKIILCSGYSEQEATRRVAGQSLTAFLQKPFQLDRLRDLLMTFSV